MKAKTKTNKKQITPVFGVMFSALKLMLVPHRANGYRPHIIRSYGIILLLASVIGLSLGYNFVGTGDVLGRQTEVTISSLLEQTNAERAKALEPALKLDDKLTQAAYLKAQDMFTDQYWAHVAPDGTAPWRWFGDVGYNYDAAGENLAKNFTTTSATMAAWMTSDGHRANILNADYREVGFAVVDGELNGKPTSLIVALYGQPANGTVAGMQSPVDTSGPSGPLNILAQLSISLKSMSPVLLVSLGLVVLAMLVALVSHGHKHKLPKAIRSTWRRHHGLYKGIGLAVFAVILLFVSAGGQI